MMLLRQLSYPELFLYDISNIYLGSNLDMECRTLAKVQYLVDSGADVLLCDDRGLTVMDWVGRYRLSAVQERLR